MEQSLLKEPQAKDGVNSRTTGTSATASSSSTNQHGGGGQKSCYSYQQQHQHGGFASSTSSSSSSTTLSSNSVKKIYNNSYCSLTPQMPMRLQSRSASLKDFSTLWNTTKNNYHITSSTTNLLVPPTASSQAGGTIIQSGPSGSAAAEKVHTVEASVVNASAAVVPQSQAQPEQVAAVAAGNTSPFALPQQGTTANYYTTSDGAGAHANGTTTTSTTTTRVVRRSASERRILNYTTPASTFPLLGGSRGSATLLPQRQNQPGMLSTSSASGLNRNYTASGSSTSTTGIHLYQYSTPTLDFRPPLTTTGVPLPQAIGAHPPVPAPLLFATSTKNDFRKIKLKPYEEHVATSSCVMKNNSASSSTSATLMSALHSVPPVGSVLHQPTQTTTHDGIPASTQDIMTSGAVPAGASKQSLESTETVLPHQEQLSKGTMAKQATAVAHDDHGEQAHCSHLQTLREIEVPEEQAGLHPIAADQHGPSEVDPLQTTHDEASTLQLHKQEGPERPEVDALVVALEHEDDNHKTTSKTLTLGVDQGQESSHVLQQGDLTSTAGLPKMEQDEQEQKIIVHVGAAQQYHQQEEELSVYTRSRTEMIHQKKRNVESVPPPPPATKDEQLGRNAMTRQRIQSQMTAVKDRIREAEAAVDRLDKRAKYMEAQLRQARNELETAFGRMHLNSGRHARQQGKVRKLADDCSLANRERSDAADRLNEERKKFATLRKRWQACRDKASGVLKEMTLEHQILVSSSISSSGAGQTGEHLVHQSSRDASSIAHADGSLVEQGVETRTGTIRALVEGLDGQERHAGPGVDAAGLVNQNSLFCNTNQGETSKMVLGQFQTSPLVRSLKQMKPVQLLTSSTSLKSLGAKPEDHEATATGNGCLFAPPDRTATSSRRIVSTAASSADLVLAPPSCAGTGNGGTSSLFQQKQYQHKHCSSTAASGSTRLVPPASSGPALSQGTAQAVCISNNLQFGIDPSPSPSPPITTSSASSGGTAVAESSRASNLKPPSGSSSRGRAQGLSSSTLHSSSKAASASSRSNLGAKNQRRSTSNLRRAPEDSPLDPQVLVFQPTPTTMTGGGPSRLLEAALATAEKQLQMDRTSSNSRSKSSLRKQK
ncbi:unnamed protein product [Amoebophrya sp. A25]|nr:unnamed protein product [Amoebophrya sp. A25]|eukprot:GSA25T00007243001.1